MPAIRETYHQRDPVPMSKSSRMPATKPPPPLTKRIATIGLILQGIAGSKLPLSAWYRLWEAAEWA